MELHQVRYVLAVVETRNFTRAAERCHVSQPALTKAIKKLEAELDGPIFYRDRGGAKLTTLGEMLLPRWRRLADDSEAVHRLASHHRHLRKVPLRVGVLCTIGPGRLAPRLEAFRARAPEVELELQILTHEALVNGLEDAAIELAITNGDLLQRDWAVVKPLYEESYVVAMPPDHPLEGQASVALPDLEGLPYIDRLACELRQTVIAAAEAAGFELYARTRTENEAWIECLVRAGTGVALLPVYSLVSDDTPRRPLVEPSVSRTIALVRSADHPASPAARALWTLLRSA